ncbi:hypothetical protein M569_11537 [Genlisea aurea]|uniref:Uncharacterized protein n=1 Tax=Genlisea aurea TaxID=192259 RepID=S8DTW0_9LAMI|nr:hypothetical protein M569_11537 [Genlisea aurea]
MEGGVVFDDDVFYADLSRQLSLLILDDDEDDDFCPSANLKAVIHPKIQPSFQQQMSKRESKGTGVFIPRSLNPRRKNVRQGKFDQNSRGVLLPSSYHQQSFNVRRF